MVENGLLLHRVKGGLRNAAARSLHRGQGGRVVDRIPQTCSAWREWMLAKLRSVEE
jgi:hypothetical protein